MTKKYVTTDALDDWYIGIEFYVEDGQNPVDVACRVMDNHGYDEWCDENGYTSYHFEFEEVD